MKKELRNYLWLLTIGFFIVVWLNQMTTCTLNQELIKQRGLGKQTPGLFPGPIGSRRMASVYP